MYTGLFRKGTELLILSGQGREPQASCTFFGEGYSLPYGPSSQEKDDEDNLRLPPRHYIKGGPQGLKRTEEGLNERKA